MIKFEPDEHVAYTSKQILKTQSEFENKEMIKFINE